MVCNKSVIFISHCLGHRHSLESVCVSEVSELARGRFRRFTALSTSIGSGPVGLVELSLGSMSIGPGPAVNRVSISVSRSERELSELARSR